MMRRFLAFLLLLYYSFNIKTCSTESLQPGNNHLLPTSTTSASFIDSFADILLLKAAQDDANPIAGEIFDKISNDYVNYSKFLTNSSIKTILRLRQSLLGRYTNLEMYLDASVRFDRFVTDFRPKSTNFDLFAFTSIDFLAQPLIGARNASGPELATLRTEIIQSIPQYATTRQRLDFVSFLDDLISTFPHGGNLNVYLTYA